MSEWKEVKIEDITTKLGDGLHGTPKYSDDGEYYFVNGNNLRGGEIVLDRNTKRVSKVEFNKYKKEINERTLLVSINGTLGNIAYYKGEKIILGKSACYFNVKEEVSLEFVRYVLESRNFKHYISKFSSGTTIQNLSLKAMREFSFFLPELFEQKEIAKTLSSLDSKISLLRQQNETLEELAQTLFKRWFVDFEFPFDFTQGKPDENGKPYKSSGGKMVESELGEIPEGWRIGTLGNFSVLKSGYAFKSVDFIDLNSIKAIKIKDLQGKGVVDITDCSSIESNLTTLDRVKFFKLSEGDIVLAMSGNTTGKIGVIPPHENELYLNQRVGKFFLRDSTFTSFLYNFLMSGNYEERILSMGYGSAQPNINPSQIESIEMLIPKSNILSNYIKISNPIYKEVLSNNSQIQSLTELRDTLLPKLMSGEFTINEL